MIINKNFSGANITVKRIDGDTVYLENQIRDTTEDWFYWAFVVERAAGRTIKFQFDKDVRVGYFGAAKSYDLKNWEWTGKWDDERSFTYTFGENENKVYFAHNMIYSPEMFDDFCEKNSLSKKLLCKSNKGRDIPYIEIGQGNKLILLTSRHHACESTGTYVLQGFIEGYLDNPIPGYKIIAVPFVDYDGVVDGDQGKARAPHDHNRDYSDDFPPLYNSTRAIKELAENNSIGFAFDFHAPWHFSGENNSVFIVQNSHEKLPLMKKFSKCLESCITPSSLPYSSENDHAPDVTWNKTGSCTFANYMLKKHSPELAFSLETTYFDAQGTKFSQSRATELGKCFLEALRKYIKK